MKNGGELGTERLEAHKHRSWRTRSSRNGVTLDLNLIDLAITFNLRIFHERSEFSGEPVVVARHRFATCPNISDGLYVEDDHQARSILFMQPAKHPHVAGVLTIGDEF